MSSISLITYEDIYKLIDTGYYIYTGEKQKNLIFNSIENFFKFVKKYKKNKQVENIIIYDNSYNLYYIYNILQKYIKKNQISTDFKFNNLIFTQIKYKNKQFNIPLYIILKKLYKDIKNNNVNISKDILYISMPLLLKDININPLSFIYSLSFLLYDTSNVEEYVYKNLLSIISDTEFIEFITFKTKYIKMNIDKNIYIDNAKDILNNEYYINSKIICNILMQNKINNIKSDYNNLSEKYNIHSQVIMTMDKKINKFIKYFKGANNVAKI